MENGAVFSNGRTLSLFMAMGYTVRGRSERCGGIIRGLRLRRFCVDGAWTVRRTVSGRCSVVLRCGRWTYFLSGQWFTPSTGFKNAGGRCALNSIYRIGNGLQRVDGENWAWTVKPSECGKIFSKGDFILLNDKRLHCRKRFKTVKFSSDAVVWC